MKRSLPPALLLFLFSVAYSQPDTSRSWVYPVHVIAGLNKVPTSTSTDLRSRSQRIRLAGYVYDQYNEQERKFTENHRRVFDYNRLTPVLSWIASKNDTLMRNNLQLDPEASLSDMLDVLLPGIINENFLRQPGEEINALRHNEIQEKQNGSWITVSRRSSRMAAPHGYAYASTYSFYQQCPADLREYTTSAHTEGDFWITSADIALIDCESKAIKETYREVRKINSKKKQVSFEVLKKQGDGFTRLQLTTYAYDDQSRLVEQIETSGQEKRRYIFEYDEFGKQYYTRLQWLNNDWEITAKSVYERQAANGITHIIITRQNKSDGTWKNLQKETYRYDELNREIYAQLANWRSAGSMWINLETIETRYNAAGLISEELSVNEEGDAYKIQIFYDDADKIIRTESFTCGAGDCAQENFTPLFRSYYHDHRTGPVDYWRSEKYVNGSWARNDSIANAYDEEGLLTQMYYGNELTNLKFRYTFSYDDLVTGIEGNETGIAVYPNPVKDVVFIRHPETDYFVDIINLQGSTLKRLRNQGSIDVSDLSPGIYALIITSKRGRYATKIFR